MIYMWFTGINYYKLATLRKFVTLFLRALRPCLKSKLKKEMFVLEILQNINNKYVPSEFSSN
jgi:hypothetical protein